MVGKKEKKQIWRRTVVDGGKNKHSQALQRSAYLRSPLIVVNDDDICKGERKRREGPSRT